MLSNIVPPIMFPVHGFPGFCLPRVRNAEMLKEPMPEVRQEGVLPRELPRLRASALTGGKQYGSVTDVLQIVYGQDFGAILKEYVENHLAELHRIPATFSCRRRSFPIISRRKRRSTEENSRSTMWRAHMKQ